ncbi:hypothetical protein OEZ86_011679 [Tetradesmus obliquus]|nr:hypothetical protein OEZ86_011679 [Tetradesmus obliquus]
MADAYDFAEHDGEDLARAVSKLRSNLKSRDVVLKHLKLAAGVLEKAPQDVAALGSAAAGLAALLIDKHILGSKHKDVRMYAAVCLAHMLRVYAPDTPYEDKELEPVFDLLLWSVQLVQEYQAPMFELAVSVLQTISQTKSYYLLLDMGREDMVLDWARGLLQCINAGSQPHAGPQVLEVLNGLIGDESGATDAQLEVLLSHLVPPKSQENPAACQMALALLRSCEAAVKPQLQKFLTTLILSPISSNSDLHQHCYTLIYQLYQAVPQVLLPVIPHMTSEMLAEDPGKRAEATQLVCQLFSVPGNRLVAEYGDVFDELLHRFKDAEVGIRLHLVEFAPTLVAAAGSSERQEKVVREAAVRLQDYDDKVRIAAVKSVCQCARQLLAGPAGAASGGTAATAGRPQSAVGTLLDSQEEDEAAAAELGVAYTPPEKELDLGFGAADAAAGVAAGTRDVAWLQEVLKGMCMRLRDTKVSVRKQTASSLMAVFRTVAAAGTGEQLAKYCWLPARMLLCCKSDVELRAHLIEGVMRDGLLGPQALPAQAAAAWVQLWLAANPMDRETLMVMLAMRARLQGDALAFLVLRRKLSGTTKDPDAAEPIRQDLERASRNLAASMAPFSPNPSKAPEGLAALQAVRDNHVFGALQQALAPGATAQAFSKARTDALSRVGSRSTAADFISQLLLWARPAAWFPPPLLAALLQLAGGDLEGEQADLVRGAFQLAQRLSKYAPMLFAGLLPQLHSLLRGAEPDLQQLAAQLLALCAKEQRKRGMLLAASPDAAVAKLVKQQLLPCMRQLARGSSSAGAAGGKQSSKRKQRADTEDALDAMEEDDADADDAEADYNDSQAAAGAVCNPRAAKWATYAIAYCQDHGSARAELSQLAADLAGSLDSGEAETAAKLQALATIGRLLPDVFSQHAEQLLSFVLDDYLLAYLDAAVTAPAGAAAGSSGRSQPSLSTPASLTSPSSRGRGSSQLGTAGGSSQVEAAGVWLKGAALKALAAGCVPDSDADDLPVETLRVATRLAQDLEGLLEPSEEARPSFLADVPDEVAGQLRLAAAASLLRLARRHDSRLGAGCYCMLALVMQDNQTSVRGVFAAKLYKLVSYFNLRRSTHQLAAKYAAMLPLAAVDPELANKEAAARMLREWVHSRRAAVQQSIMSAAAAAGGAAGVRGGGSTLQEQPEMLLPYGLYILAHHPDFPQPEEAAEDPGCCTPFQFMLQFMLQPLLVESGSTAAGAFVPALRKMCAYIKYTADRAEEPATSQLYVLCDMALAMLRALAQRMGLEPGLLTAKHPGGITLPASFYRPLDKEERGAAGVSYLPPGFEVELDPEPVAALAQPPHMHGQAAAAAAARHGRGTKPRSTAAAAATTSAGAAGRGSKRRAQASRAAEEGSAAEEDGDDASEQRPAKRSKGRGGAAAGAGGRGSKPRRAAKADSDDGWEAGDVDAPPSAAKAQPDQLTSRQKQLQMQKQQAAQQPRQAKHAAAASPADSDTANEYYTAVFSSLKANGIEIRPDAGGGRGKGVFATKGFQQGDVLWTERPLAAVQQLDSKLEASTCSHCFKAVGTVEQHVGGKICCLINELSDATEEDDLRQVQDRVDKIQAAVNSQFLEGLLQGRVDLPLTGEVDMAEPVKCRAEGPSSSSSSSSDDKGKGKAAAAPQHSASCSHSPAGGSSSSSGAGAGSSSSRRAQKPAVQQLHGVAVNRAKLGHKAAWWDVVAEQQEEAEQQEGSESDGDSDSEEVDAAELRAQLKELAADSLALLRAGLQDSRFPQLFDLQLYGSLVGMFELNNLALAVPAPVARYKDMLLHPAEYGVDIDAAAAAVQEVQPLLEALGDDADAPAEGTGFYALQSCVNHSCAPNAAATCLPSGQMVLRALTDIAAGSEVLLSYIEEEGAGLQERRAMLRDYGFVCSCERCSAEELAGALQAQQLVAA